MAGIAPLGWGRDDLRRSLSLGDDGLSVRRLLHPRWRVALVCVSGGRSGPDAQRHSRHHCGSPHQKPSGSRSARQKAWVAASPRRRVSRCAAVSVSPHPADRESSRASIVTRLSSRMLLYEAWSWRSANRLVQNWPSSAHRPAAACSATQSTVGSSSPEGAASHPASITSTTATATATATAARHARHISAARLTSHVVPRRVRHIRGTPAPPVSLIALVGATPALLLGRSFILCGPAPGFPARGLLVEVQRCVGYGQTGDPGGTGIQVVLGVPRVGGPGGGGRCFQRSPSRLHAGRSRMDGALLLREAHVAPWPRRATARGVTHGATRWLPNVTAL